MSLTASNSQYSHLYIAPLWSGQLHPLPYYPIPESCCIANIGTTNGTKAAARKVVPRTT